MNNSTKYKFSKLDEIKIKEVYQDDDGIWAHLNNGYIWSGYGTHICNGENIQQLKQALKEVVKEC